ncbi:hypothetical protein H9A01_000934 [Listeria monocytogenes]|nr:hypothetical protein [Listeria monocytogenes]EGC2922555.1 hypothetical protein [Listeria monocytogenes]EGC2934704.1 hypothetical protein [Listeria monocytogenes]EGC2983887.1 hypothetical protein [Listeria monocytogenes]
MEYGFKIKQLILTGGKVEPRVLKFNDGLNLLTGPSNTGKTYVFQCIDFVFGKSKLPKKITESKGYEDIFIEIEEYSSQKISTISRSLINKVAFFYPNTAYTAVAQTNPIQLDGKMDNDSISSYLLKLCGFKLPIKIKKNKNFLTVNFSFRNLAPFLFIKEDVMISERSPIYVGSYTDRTLCFNIFKFLLTGIDDSTLKKTEKKEIWTAKKSANIDLLTQLLEDEIEKIDLLKRQQDEIAQSNFDEMNLNEIEAIQTEITELNDQLSQNERLKHKLQADISYNENLKYKFHLLKEQYLSDIERLQFIDEGSFLLNQLYATKCPHCGETITEFGLHNHEDINMEDVNQSCNFEIEKIQKNLNELQKSIITVESIMEDLHEEFLKVIDGAAILKKNLESVLHPKLANLQEQWDRSLQHNVLLSEMESANAQVEYLQTLITNTSSTKHKNNENSNDEIIKTINESSFPTMLETNLKNCLFLENDSLPITFYINSDQELDFLIKGEEREVFGKGYRSIISSIFQATLMLYCKAKDLPHLNSLILDSPVNAFKDTDENEQLPKSIQNRFFNFLYSNFKDSQIIVIENSSVPEDLANKINILEFTRDKTKGRYGFF